MQRVPVIDLTDLYLPPQDAGDNFDLVMPYGLPEIDLRAVILDATDAFRQPRGTLNGEFDHKGPRDPGVIAVWQMNAIFGARVPCATSPFRQMRAPDDPMTDVPRFQQHSIELLLDTLRASDEPVVIMSQGSLRTLAAAYNREPALLHEKTARVHISAGACSPAYNEWNVNLDPHAFVRVLQSDLPIALYPCATADGPFGYHRNNSFWQLPDLRFVASMHPALRRYLGYAFGRVVRPDFLRAMEEDLPDDLMEQVYATATDAFYRRSHQVWETALWINIADRRLVQRADGTYRIMPAADVTHSDRVLPNDLRPCTINLQADGRFTYAWTDQPSSLLMYDRGDPHENERALQEALPALYQSFVPGDGG